MSSNTTVNGAPVSSTETLRTSRKSSRPRDIQAFLESARREQVKELMQVSYSELERRSIYARRAG
jgi:hypothetical protein